MTWYNIVSLIVTALALPTLVGLLWKDLIERKKNNSAKLKNAQREEDRQDLRRIIQEETCSMRESIEQLHDKLDKVSDGTLCTLRNDILNCYYKALDKGYRNDYDYTNIHDLYEAYVALNGNSFVKDVMSRFDSLPTKEELKLQSIHSENKNTRQKGDQKYEGGHK